MNERIKFDMTSLVCKEKMIFAVDFDGCLCDSVYPDAGEPNKPLIELLKALRESGHIVILWTCRSGEALQTAVDFCKEYGLEFDYVNDNADEIKKAYGENQRKIYADLYIDDRCMKWTAKEGIA